MIPILRFFALLSLIVLAVCIQTAAVRSAPGASGMTVSGQQALAKLDLSFRENSGIFLPGQSVILDVILHPTVPPGSPLPALPQPLFASLKFLSQPHLPPVSGFHAPISFSTPLPISFVTPDKEGVYEIVLSVQVQPPIQQTGRLTAMLQQSDRLHKVEVRRQIIVLSPHKPRRPSGSLTLSQTKELLRTNVDSQPRRQFPLLPRMSELSQTDLPRLADWSRMTDSFRAADLLSVLSLSRINARFLSPRLSPSADLPSGFAGMNDADYFWWPDDLGPDFVLDVQKGKPYLIELEYATHIPQSIEIIVADRIPNRELELHGKVLNLRRVNAGAHIHIAEEVVQDTRQETTGTHQLLFWPTTESPELHISNSRPDTDSAFRSIRISQVSASGLHGQQRLPKLFEGQAQRKRIGQLLGHTFMQPPAKGGAAIGHSESMNIQADWLEAYQQCSQLIEQLHRGGYDGLSLTVLSKDISLYPTVRQSPNYLEMMFQRFNSEELTLIPAVEFNIPIPSLELLLSQHPGSIEEIVIGHVGVTSSDLPAKRHYNLLHPAVQQAMGEIVIDLVNRFGHHPSFGGVAVVLSPETFAQLPFAIYPPDDYTFSQFRRENEILLGIAFPNEDYHRQTLPMQQFLEQKNTARIQFLQSDRKIGEAWIRWRADKVSGFYISLARHISSRQSASGRPDTPLYLLGGTMFDQPAIKEYTMQTLPRNDMPLQAVQLLGFDLHAIAQAESLCFLRPVRLSHTNCPAYRGLNSLDSVSLFSKQSRQPSAGRLSGEIKLSGIPGVQFVHVGNVGAEWRMLECYAPAHTQSRRRFVRQLAQSDVHMFMDGGYSLPFGQESAMFDLLDTFRRLPVVHFTTFQTPPDASRPAQPPVSIQPLTIRSTNLPEGMLMYIVNDAPFAVEADFAFSANPQSTMLELTGHRMIRTYSRNSQRSHTGTHTWRASLLPYDLLAVMISDSDANIESVTVHRPPAIFGPEGSLKKKVDELELRTQAARQDILWEKLPNADFEEPLSQNGTIKHWDAQGLTAQLDQNAAYHGLYSVKITNNSTQQGSFLSQPLDIPATGRMSVSMFVGVPTGVQSVPMSVVLKATHQGKPVVRSVPIEATLMQSLANTAPDGPVRWQPLAVPFRRLPVDLENVRIGIQYSGPGTVWIDHITLHPAMFLPDEMIELQKIPLVASQRYTSERVSDLISLLESHWAQFLFDHVPVQHGQPSAPPQRTPATKESTPQKQPTLYQRVKNWVTPG